MALLKQDVHFPPAVFPRSTRADAQAPYEDAVLARATAAPVDAGAIRSARLVLRAPQPADAETIAHLANDRRIAENTSRLPYPYTLAHAQEWIALTQSAGQTGSYGKDSCGKAFLVTQHDGTVVGGCGYGMLLEPVNEIGYWFGVPHWGQGYATEAARALIDHIFETESDDVIAAGARVTNTASRRVIEKCGFAWTGARLMRVRALATSVPIDRFRLTRAEWERQRTYCPPLQAG